MRLRWKKYVLVACLAVFAAASLLVVSGCGQSEPKVIVFLGKSSQSYEDTRAMVDEAKKKFGDKITWEEYDYDDASSKGAISKYSVSMNPTIIITNSEGAIKQTYMGKPMKDELLNTIEGFIPGKKTAPSTTPGTQTVPGSPYPPDVNPAPAPVPQTTAP